VRNALEELKREFQPEDEATPTQIRQMSWLLAFDEEEEEALALMDRHIVPGIYQTILYIRA
jgi:hypothetical protein